MSNMPASHQTRRASGSLPRAVDILARGEPVRAFGARTPRQLPIRTTRVGLEFPVALTYDAWAQAGQKLFQIVDSSAWYLGDWLVYGQEKYENRYRAAIEQAGLDYQTLRNYAWIARKFDISRRRTALTFQHHAEVASLSVDEQDLWLDRAEEHQWSRNELRRQLRNSRQTQRRGVSQVLVVPSFPVPRESLESWRGAAEHVDTDLDSWIIATLDRAANTESTPDE